MAIQIVLFLLAPLILFFTSRPFKNYSNVNNVIRIKFLHEFYSSRGLLILLLGDDCQFLLAMPCNAYKTGYKGEIVNFMCFVGFELAAEYLLNVGVCEWKQFS